MTYFDKIVSELQSDTYFQKFKFRKRDGSFRLKTNYGVQSIELRHWNYGNLSLEIQPQYHIRFDILSKWFEKFSYRTITSQRDDSQIGFDGQMLGRQNLFDFEYYDSSTKYHNEIINLKKTIKDCSTEVFDKYSTLEKCYNNIIIPMLNNGKKLPGIGVEWLFESLTLCKILHPENYDKLKHILLKHAEHMMTYKEPNMSMYYDKLNEILSYLENYDFKKELQKITVI